MKYEQLTFFNSGVEGIPRQTSMASDISRVFGLFQKYNISFKLDWVAQLVAYASITTTSS